MAKERITIPMMPATSGLINTGGQATVPEPSWWEARNVTIGSDGRLSKRRGLEQWGQTLKAPASGGVGWQEIFSDMSHFNVSTNGTTCTIEVGTGSVVFETTSTTEGADFALAARLIQPNDGTIAAGETGLMDFRFMFRTLRPMPAISTATLWRGFGGGFENNSGVSVGFLILNTGIYVQNGGTFTLVPGTDIDDGSWHVVEMRQTSTTSVTIIIDEGTPIVATYSDSATFDPQANQALLGVTANANGLIEVEVALMQGRSGNGNITGVPITHIDSWSSPDPLTRHLLVVAGDIIYEDRDWSAVYRPVTNTFAGDLTLFTPFGENLLIVNPRMPTRLWTGDLGDEPDIVPATFPAHAYIATQHQARCVIAREDFPLRVYVSAANSLSDWTTESVVSPSGESFFFDIPDAVGERITNLIGDFYGQLLIFTHNSVYALVGSGVSTYTLRLISSRVGCEGPRGASRMGGDILFLSKHGLHSLQTVQEYGDISTTYLTAPLRNLWQRDSFFDQPKILSNYRSSVVHAPHFGRTYVCVQNQEGTIPNRVYELNHDTNQWGGPWTLDCEASHFVLLGAPTTPTLLFGDQVGRVGMPIDDRKFDFESTGYTFRLRSARFDCRSLGPHFTRRTKRWRALRIYIMPRGAWELAVSWVADGHDRGGSDTPRQNRYKEALLDSTFFLDTSLIADSEKVGVINVTLDVRSKWLEFTIEQAGTDEDAIVVGVEIDFEVSQDDIENV